MVVANDTEERVSTAFKQTLTRDSQQIVNPKGEMKGSAITGPVGKEAAELWPVCLALSLEVLMGLLTLETSVLPATPVSSCEEASCARWMSLHMDLDGGVARA